MNKFDAINKVMMSDLHAEDKCLMVELITRADAEWKCWPSVERLCKARGMKHEKNFKGADYYLPGLVTKVKRGRKNMYHINTPALEGLSEAQVTIRHTNTPAREGVNTPAVADNTPAVEGANTSIDTTEDNSTPPSSEGGYEYLGSLNDEDFKPFTNVENLSYDYLANNQGVKALVAAPKEVTTSLDTPAREGVSEEEYEKGEQYLEVLITKNNIVGTARATARRRYHDEDYMPKTHGLMRAGWVVGHLSDQEKADAL